MEEVWHLAKPHMLGTKVAVVRCGADNRAQTISVTLDPTQVTCPVCRIAMVPMPPLTSTAAVELWLRDQPWTTRYAVAV